MKHVELGIALKAAKAHLEGSLTDKMLIEIADKAELDGANKNPDLMIDIAKYYGLPIGGYLMSYSEFTRDYRRDRIEALEEENAEEIARAIKDDVKPDNDKLAKNIREIELVILKNRIYKTSQSVFFKYYPAYDYFTDENCGELYEAKREIL
jgi:hypothetical protein